MREPVRGRASVVLSTVLAAGAALALLVLSGLIPQHLAGGPAAGAANAVFRAVILLYAVLCPVLLVPLWLTSLEFTLEGDPPVLVKRLRCAGRVVRERRFAAAKGDLIVRTSRGGAAGNGLDALPLVAIRTRGSRRNDVLNWFEASLYRIERSPLHARP